MAGPEASLRARILAALRRDYPPSKGEVLVFGRPASGSTGPGHPDLFGVAQGNFFGLEVKVADGKPTPLQIERITQLRRALAYVWIVRSELAALKAVFMAKTGGRRPMADEPIDFDNWLKGLGSDAPKITPADDEPETVETSDDGAEDSIAALFGDPVQEVASAEEAPVSEAAREFFDALEGDEALAAAAATPASDEMPEEEREPTPFDDVPVLLGVTEMRDYPTIENQERAEAAEHRRATAQEVADATRPSIQEQADADQTAATLQEDIRAVGDRVTVLWEQVGMLGSLTVMAINELRQFRADFNKAMAEDDEEVPEPMLLPAWKQPEIGTMGTVVKPEESTGLGVTKRQRRRRAAS